MIGSNEEEAEQGDQRENAHATREKDVDFVEPRETSETAVRGFYAGQKILITGGTGFLGKILTEKLLRSCPDISKIYLLIRSKRGIDSQQRANRLFDEPIYDQMRMEGANFRDKVVTINGDCSVKGLALSERDRDLLLRNVSLVFHLAASVQFNESLESATINNVRSTAEILDLCERMPKLKSIVHVSTAYAHCHLQRIEERFYDYPIQAETLLTLADASPGTHSETTAFEVARAWPNTYTFTKAIAEGLVKDRSRNLPIGIFRPAIVTSTAHEPLPGWIDNIYGPTGVVAGALAGLFKVLRADGNMLANIVPVDLTVNALIVSAWAVGTGNGKSSTSPVPIYNFVSSTDAPLTWGQFSHTSQSNAAACRSFNAIWYRPIVLLIRSKTFYFIAILLMHLLPALLLDFFRICLVRKPKYIKLYRKLHNFSNAITYFCLNNWLFTNDNVRAMWLKLHENEQKLFPFDMRNFDWQTYLRYYVLGIKRYILNEELNSLPANRNRVYRFYSLHWTVKTFLSLTTAGLILSLFSATFSFFSN